MRQQLIQRLRELELQRSQVESMDRAMSQLSPSEQLILRKLVMEPGKNHALILCQLLDVEVSTVYRRKDRALQKLEAMLYPA